MSLTVRSELEYFEEDKIADFRLTMESFVENVMRTQREVCLVEGVLQVVWG